MKKGFLYLLHLWTLGTDILKLHVMIPDVLKQDVLKPDVLKPVLGYPVV